MIASFLRMGIWVWRFWSCRRIDDVKIRTSIIAYAGVSVIFLVTVLLCSNPVVTRSVSPLRLRSATSIDGSAHSGGSFQSVRLNQPAGNQRLSEQNSTNELIELLQHDSAKVVALLEELPASSERESLLKWVAGNWARLNPDEAVNWATQLANLRSGTWR